MMHYIIQTIAFQLLFLLIYDLFLNKETFFNWNRVYLLLTTILSIVLPFVKIESFKKVVPQNYIIELPEIILGKLDTTINNSEILNNQELKVDTSFWSIIFYTGVAATLFIFLFKIIKIIKLILISPKSYKGKLTFVMLQNTNVAFSFFNYIFLGDLISADKKESILRHELIHVKQKHTVDLMFFEALRIVFWFNPLVYIYQNKLTTLHEFIADDQAVKDHDKHTYYQDLLSQIFETKNISFINPFFKQSLIKKRIIMLTKTKSKQIHLFKYALIIPVVLAILLYTSSVEKGYAVNKVFKTGLVFKQGSSIISKVKEIKALIEKKGKVSNREEKGLNLLLQIIKGNKLNSNLIKEMDNYVAIASNSELSNKISSIFNDIKSQGTLNEEEELALKRVLVFTSEKGFEDPFFDDIIKDIDMPFSVIEKVPVFPGCEDLSNLESKKCFSNNITQHVSIAFNTKIADSINLAGPQRVNVIFKISVDGNITEIRARAPHPALKTEAIRVIGALPKMIPGKHKGKNVNVLYSLPIIFEVKK
ncbi:hypothetical protein GCM10022291_08160 [Postechiella marina]|uniref:BlaR1 peptidase M56 n=1 Tax=Postechiella marina TaxID=943941 RepID=A0ABP8C2U6_9FLAO